MRNEENGIYNNSDYAIAARELRHGINAKRQRGADGRRVCFCKCGERIAGRGAGGRLECDRDGRYTTGLGKRTNPSDAEANRILL